MFGNNRKLKRFNAHVVLYKDFLNQNKQRQRDSHIKWFKELQRKVVADKAKVEFRKKIEADLNEIKSKGYISIPAIIINYKSI